jgi:hypothetical protein
MWQCSKCGVEIHDQFDACWKCGTRQDGTPDRAPDPESPIAAKPRDAGQIRHERIVELCSAANIIEADGLCELLEEAGIQARVVGDNLTAAAGCLPLGEATAPRIWVYENDADHARQVIGQWRSEPGVAPLEPPEDDEPATAAAPLETQDTALPSDERLRFLGQGLFVVAIVCLAAGAVWAWQNATTLSKHSATTEGRFAGVGHPRTRFAFAPPRDPNLPLQPNAPRVLAVTHLFEASYAYVVDGKSHHAYMFVESVDEAPDRVQVHYDPRNPAAHFVGSIAPPWMILLLSFAVGGFLCFVGWQFR